MIQRHQIRVTRIGYTRRLTNIHTGKTSKSIHEHDIHPLHVGRIVVAILHIYGARAIFLIFCGSKTPNLSNDKWKIRVVAIIHIYGAISIFPLFCDSKTLNLSNNE